MQENYECCLRNNKKMYLKYRLGTFLSHFFAFIISIFLLLSFFRYLHLSFPNSLNKCFFPFSLHTSSLSFALYYIFIYLPLCISFFLSPSPSPSKSLTLFLPISLFLIYPLSLCICLSLSLYLSLSTYIHPSPSILYISLSISFSLSSICLLIQPSISSMFYVQIFRTNVVSAAFSMYM